MIDILLYSHHLPAWYCIDIVRRNSVLVTWGSERVNKPLCFFFLFFFFQFGSKEGYLTKLGGKVKVRKHILPLSRSDYKFSCLTATHFLLCLVWKFLFLLRQFTFGETKIINFFLAELENKVVCTTEKWTEVL